MTDNWNLFEHSTSKPPEESKGWKTESVLDSEDFHHVPISDEIEHGLTEACPCDPEVQVVLVEGEIIRRDIIHNAWDGRDRR